MFPVSLSDIDELAAAEHHARSVTHTFWLAEHLDEK